MQPDGRTQFNLSHLVWAITVEKTNIPNIRQIVHAYAFNVGNSTMKIGANEYINWNLLKHLLRIWEEDLLTHFCLEFVSIY